MKQILLSLQDAKKTRHEWRQAYFWKTCETFHCLLRQVIILQTCGTGFTASVNHITSFTASVNDRTTMNYVAYDYERLREWPYDYSRQMRMTVSIFTELVKDALVNDMTIYRDNE